MYYCVDDMYDVDGVVSELRIPSLKRSTCLNCFAICLGMYCCLKTFWRIRQLGVTIEHDEIAENINTIVLEREGKMVRYLQSTRRAFPRHLTGE